MSSPPSAAPAPTEVQPTAQTEAADRMAHAAVVVTGVRCVLMYMVLPVIGPVASQYSGVILPVSIVLHLVTLATTTLAVSRAWRSGHRLRVPYAALGVCFFLWSFLSLFIEIPLLLS